jgi:hypothetical protein
VSQAIIQYLISGQKKRKIIMLDWLKNMFTDSNKSTGYPPATRAQSPAGNGGHDFSPGGRHTLTHGGQTVIPRPVAEPDPLADAFEAKLLRWLQYGVKVKPLSCAGTNTLFWKFDFQGHDVEIAVIGQTKNTTTPPAAGTTWVLRVEEKQPLTFIPLLEQQFVAAHRVKRKLDDAGKTRVQFKSNELSKDSVLAPK